MSPLASAKLKVNAATISRLASRMVLLHFQQLSLLHQTEPIAFGNLCNDDSHSSHRLGCSRKFYIDAFFLHSSNASSRACSDSLRACRNVVLRACRLCLKIPSAQSHNFDFKPRAMLAQGHVLPEPGAILSSIELAHCGFCVISRCNVLNESSAWRSQHEAVL